MKTQRKLIGQMILWAAAIYAVMVLCASRGQHLPALAVGGLIILASPFTMMELGAEEGRSRRSVINPKHGSWAFIIGDTLALPIAGYLGSRNWSKLPTDGWHTSWWWPIVALTIGVIGGHVFHFKNAVGYREVGATAALASPTKIWHDRIGCYPLLLGILIYTGIPQLAALSSIAGGMSLCVATWVVFAVADARRGLDLKKLHPNWDPKSCEARPWPSAPN